MPPGAKKAEFGRLGDKFILRAAEEPGKGAWRAGVIVMKGDVNPEVREQALVLHAPL